MDLDVIVLRVSQAGGRPHVMRLGYTGTISYL